MKQNMRKLLDLRLNIPIAFILAVLGLPFAEQAQAQGYAFENDTATFTSISESGTELNRTSIGDDDDGDFEIITLSTDFEFFLFNKRVTTLVPTTNLFLTTSTVHQCRRNLLRCHVPTKNNARGHSAGGQNDPAGGIFPYWTDAAYLNGQSGVFHELSNDAVGSRVLTIEFSKFAIARAHTTPSISVQVKLYESNSQIEFIYKRETDNEADGGTLAGDRAIGLVASDRFLGAGSPTLYYFIDSTAADPMPRGPMFYGIAPSDRPNIPATDQVYRFTPALTLPAIENISTLPNTEITEVLPVGFGGTGTITYTLTGPPASGETSPGPLPAGFSFDAATRTLSGMSAVVIGGEILTYTATDDSGTANDMSDDESASVTFYLGVLPADGPVYFPDSADRHFTAGQAINLTIPDPVSTGPGLKDGNEGRVNTTVPPINGVTFSFLTISGTVTDTAGDESNMGNPYLYKRNLIDTNSVEGGFTYNIFVSDPRPVAPTLPTSSYPLATSTDITPITLPAFDYTAGSTPSNPITYSVTGLPTSGMPTDLSFNDTNRTISGTTPATPGTHNITYTATDNSDSNQEEIESVTFTIVVQANPEPVAPANIAFTFTVREDISMVDGVDTALAFFGGDGDLMYSLAACTTCAEKGLSLTLDADSAALSGTFDGTNMDDATLEDDPLSFSYTATDADNNAFPATFNVTLIDPLPMVPDDFVTSHVFVPGEDVDVTLPDFEGGNTPLTYSLTDSSDSVIDTSTVLTADLMYPAAGMIMGMIEADTADVDDSVVAVTYTYTATDADGDEAPADFTIAVVDPRPEAPTSIPSNARNLLHGQLIDSAGITLPPFTYIADNVTTPTPLTVTLTQGIPGLTFTANEMDRTITITGTPDTTEDLPVTYPVIYKATDGTDFDQIMFDIVVTDNPMPAVPDGLMDLVVRPGQVLPNDVNHVDKVQLLEFPFPDAPTGTMVTYQFALQSAAEDDITALMIGNLTTLTFDPATRLIHGTVPTEAGNASEDFFYSAIDDNATSDTADFDKVDANFTITIVDSMPMPPSDAQDIMFEAGRVTMQTLEPFTGGDSPLTYRISSGSIALPDWVSVTSNEDEFILTGTAPGTASNDAGPERTYSYVAEDDDGDVGELASFTIIITDARPMFSQEAEAEVPSLIEVIQNSDIPDLTLPVATAGPGDLAYETGDLMYSLPGLPPGLEFEPSTRVLSGKPTGSPTTPNQFSYRVQDGDGDFDTIEFNIQVLEDVDPMVPIPVPPATSFAIVLYPGQDLAVDPVDALPVFTGGNGMLNYTLSDAPILLNTFGLTFDPESRMFTGEAPADTDAVVNVNPVTFRYTATDTENTDDAGDDGSAFVDITIAIEDTVPQAPSGPQPHTVTVGVEVTTGTIILNEFTGGDGELMYITMTDPALPDGLTLTYDADLSQDRLQITGTHADTIENQHDDDPVPYTYSVRDSDGMGDTASGTFTLQVVDAIPVAPTDPQNFVFAPGDPVVATTGGNGVLLPFTGGDGDLTYAIEGTPTFPGTLDFSDDPLGLVGDIPDDTDGDGSIPKTTYTYSATDEGLDKRTVEFTVEVKDPRPELPMNRPPNYDFVLAEVVGPVQTRELPEFGYTDNDGATAPTLTYTLTGEFPLGLSFDGTSREISGTPTMATPDGNSPTFTYKATDGTDSAEYTFTITVTDDPAPQVPPSLMNLEFIPGDTVDASNGVLPEFISDDTMLTYEIYDGSDTSLDTPLMELMIGTTTLDFDDDPAMRLLSGMIEATSGNDGGTATFIYAATDSDPAEDPNNPSAGDGPDTTEATFTITITDAMPMFASSASIDSITGIVGSAIEPVDVPVVETVGTTTTTYTVDPRVSSWLTHNPTTNMLSGDPNEPISATDFTFTARDADGDTDTVEFTLNIAANEMPDPLTLTRSAFVFTPGQVLPDTGNMAITLPTTMDGNGMLTYSIRDSSDTEVETLVGGLTFTPDTRVISGTISPIDRVDSDDSIDLTTYTYRATDVDGDFVSAPFTIEVEDAMPEAPPEFNLPFDVGMANSSILPAFMTTVDNNDKGVAIPTLTYSVTREDSTARPSWLNFVAGTRELSGTPPPETEDADPLRLTYTASEDGGSDRDSVTFTLTFNSEPVPLAPPVAPQAYTFPVGQAVNQALAEFEGGRRPLTYELNTSPALPDGLSMASDFATSRVITGTITNTPENDSVAEMTYTYTATDADEESLPATFTIAVEDANLTIPAEMQAFRFAPGEVVNETLAEFTGGTDPIRYTSDDMTAVMTTFGLTFTPSARTITGRIAEDASRVEATEYTYTATDNDGNGEALSTTFTIAITDVPSLDEAAASAIPTVGANIALVASQAISSRVELALNGLSSGIDIRTLDGPHLRLNPQQQNGGSGSPVRFGVWYSAASDSLSDTRSTVTWEGTTDSTNLGFDVGFDISADASLVVGILQNSSSTSATYRNTDSDNAGTLSVDLDSTAFYVGLGYDWLDAWFANGSADSTLNDSQIETGIPASFSYQTIGLTASFEIIDSLSIGGKVESLTSDLSLTEMSDMNFSGLQTDSSQLRTAFVANYQLELGEKGNGLLIPKFEFGFRDLSLGTNTMETEVAAVGGSAMESGFGIDYIQRAWGLTVGLDMRSISVENYSSDSTQYQIRWESGNYGSGLSFQLTPHSVSETLGGIDSLYSGDYNQYQNLLERQRGGSNTQDTKGLDFEVGYGFVANYGTLTPYLKTTNYRGSGSQAEEFGIRYQTLQGLELTLRAERSLTPQTIQIFGFPLTFMQQERALTLSTRYSF